MERVEAEVNIFLNDGALHVKAFLYSNPDSFGEDGTPVYGEPDTARTSAFINGLKAAVEGEGLTPGREKRSYGGGGRGAAAKPETPAPADLADNVPECDGEKMKYEPEYTNQNTGNLVKGRFVCRKGEACSQGRDYNGKKYGRTVWEDAVRKELVGA